MVINHTAVPLNKGHLLPLGKATPCKLVMVPGVITFKAAYFAYQHQCLGLLAMCPNCEGSRQAADIQLLVEGLTLPRTYSQKDGLQLNLEFFFLNLGFISFISTLSGTVVYLIGHWFGICYFSISP